MLYYGACYYPEHWTPEQARQHIPLMQKAGINVVRMGEFAWSRFEPEQGRYRFDWLDPVIEALNKAGIKTVLGTPTCIPPMWVLARHPNLLQRDSQGLVRYPGARCHCCKNAVPYRMLSEVIVRELARHYRGMDGVIGWQIDNEFGCHGTTRCYCDHCEKAFREWLRERYKTVEAVNEAWGAAFWSFEVRNWNDIPLPRRMPAGPNPSHWLDFARFSSDTQVEFMKTQYDLLKAMCPDHFVTHNAMGAFPEVDYHKLFQTSDLATWDNYPDALGDPYHPAYGHEITRSFKNRFWVMEERSGAPGPSETGELHEQPEPGEIRRWAWQGAANGADGVVYFRWRACLSGAEQYWHGILDHDGVPRRRYAEVAKTGEEFAKAGAELEGTQVEAKVAVIRSYEHLWSIERQPGAPGFRYDDHCFELYRAAKRHGHSCDLVGLDADLARYAVVFAPCLNMVDEGLSAKLGQYVRAGGVLVLTPQSGTRTPTNLMTDRTRPGLLAPLAGVTVEECRSYHHGQTHEISFARGGLIAQTCTVGLWVEILQATTAEPVAEYRGEPYTGRPAITCNAVGKGRVFYMGVYLPRPVLEAFLHDILPDFPVKDIPEGVEVTLRKGPDRRLLFVLNNTRERQQVTLPAAYPDVLSGETVGPAVTLARNGVLVLRV